MNSAPALSESSPAAAASRPSQLQKWWIYTSLVLGLVYMAALYLPTLRWLYSVWQDNKQYSHGLLVPFISMGLVWRSRQYFSAVAPSPRLFSGGAVIALSAALLLAGRVGGFYLAEAVSLLVLLPGLVLALGGWEYLKALAVPLAYLQFMVPWMDDFVERIHEPFQLLSAKMGIAILHALGFVALQREKLIYMPNLTMEVARECSGVRFLLTIVALGSVLVYVTQRTWLRAAVVLLLGVLVTILANGLRVAMAGVMGHYYGAQMLHGPRHIFQGWFVAQVGVAALLLLNWRIAKMPSASETLENRFSPEPSHPPSDAAHPKRQHSAMLPFAAVVVALFITVLGLQVLGSPVPVPPTRPLQGFPMVLGLWNGSPSNWIAGSSYFPLVDTELVRTYRDEGGREINLYVGYFEFQGQGKSVINFMAAPLVQLLQTSQVEVGQGRSLQVNQGPFTLGRTQYSGVLWYRFPAADVAGRYEAKLRQVTGGLVRRRNNGMVVLVATPSEGDRRANPADVQAFIRHALPALHQHLP
jgi:EpsI family protein